jgi:hypothetical protein
MSNHQRILVAALLLLVAGALACVGGPQKPSVEILSPLSGSQVAVGQEVLVEYRASDTNAVIRVDLEVAGAVVDSQNSPVSDGQLNMTGVLRWWAAEPGSHTLVVYAYNRDRVASDAVGVTITVAEGEPVAGATVTLSLLLPSGTGTPGSTATIPAAAPSATATRPPAAPTATPTTPPPTATQRQAAPPPSPTLRPPTATATKPPPSPTPTTELANLWVENYTSVEICEVYFSAPGAAWGANRLLGGTRIQAGQSALWTIAPGSYDLRAVDCGQTELNVVWSQPIYDNWTWKIMPPPPPPAEPLSLTLVNYTADAICELYMYATSDWPDIGPNQTAGYCIPVGGSQTYGIESGDWTIDAYDSTSHWLSSWQGYLPGGVMSIDLY